VKTKLALAALAFAGCHPSPRTTTSSIVTTAMRADIAPLQLPLELRVARGEVAVRDADDGSWRPLSMKTAKPGVREVRTLRRGAMLSIGHGDAGGRIWLRAGSRVRLGQDAQGVHVAVLEGRARVRRGGAEMPMFVGNAMIDGDFIIDRSGATPTAARPALAAWSLGLEGADTGAGVGRMDMQNDAGKTEALELKKVAVHVHTQGDFAITEVEHVFHNPVDGRPREGTFRFPVPDGAMLIGMAMEIDGKLVEGEIVEREKARQVYDKIVDEMQDPALLEWEEGNWFKLRVFPLTANGDKRLVIRYASPLVRGAGGWEYDYDLAIADHSGGGPAKPIGELTLDIDGKQVASERGVSGGLDLTVPIDKVPTVMREQRKDATYTAVRIAPDASMMSASPKVARKVAIVFDTSRSSLEGRALQDQLLAQTLGELGKDDKFVVLASDVSITASTPDFASTTPADVAAATGFLGKIEPDGASDLAAALKATAALHPTDVIYIGDGIPTWGERKPAALSGLADSIHAPISAALIGKGATTSLWGELAGRTGGRAMIVKKPEDAARFALANGHGSELPRLTAARVIVAGDASVFPQEAQTIYAGDEMVALIKTKPGAAPGKITLQGMANGRPVSREIALQGAVDELGVAQRWGADQIAALEASDAERDTIVAASRDFGVLSRYTSLLVLENDEAYKKYQIERKAQQQQLQQQQPQVTGGDLDTLGARRANLSPDEIQPGDPEIKIPAPIDAKSVVVAFPFGEIKRAVWDADVEAWMVRFLIDKDTPDGQYFARITVTHADGRIEVMSLPYVVDTKAPIVELTAKRVSGGYKITAKQIAAKGNGRKDADKVEVQLPDGSILTLTETKWGRFEGVWLTSALTESVTLRVVARDRAMNQAIQSLTIGTGK
jgi:hypothetical protein